MTSVYSPGSPIFLPNGARIFNRLVDFLRRQYVSYGFEEVITPNIYKKSLWEVSGHLQNYADDMYTVTSRARQPEATSSQPEASSCCGDGGRLAEGETTTTASSR
ncbi:threonyl-tRNA synthetase [Verticillium alfalfae VaMs.102]|uniref:Threonyl-tRNA synthetase n=1 Tax=Verticillium alfalfae (strain VaMs.102 / ATCC MYA-4576 / FGSC 10136) TaxID=526221 RepID=C9SQY6_VERA1|nr:threonyl-tRNA synthetase [Verticillium alfalfae VaMs.102]EEY21261.1 threonyl-tRNA synthetase [Verticillium alfalfae VaMs.102]